MVIPGGFQNNAGLSVQSFELLRQIVQVLGGMLNFKRFEYHFSEGAHNTNHALPFGNVNAYCVHDFSSIILYLQLESIFYSLPIQSIG